MVRPCQITAALYFVRECCNQASVQQAGYQQSCMCEEALRSFPALVQVAAYLCGCSLECAGIDGEAVSNHSCPVFCQGVL